MNLLRKIKYWGLNTKCPLCNSMLHNYLPLDNKFKITIDIEGISYKVEDYETLNVDNFMCPVCGANDRTRLYALYLNQELLQNNNRTINLLHFAPEKPLQKLLKKQKQISYRSADLFMDNVDDKVDIANMNIYADNSFDFIICSHVLEHITDVNKAISELYRILKPEAKAIIMVPILPDLKNDFEDPDITTPEGRLKHYGQDDHVRIFSKNGFISKLRNNGFGVNELGVDFFGKDCFNKNKITLKSILYIVEKN